MVTTMKRTPIVRKNKDFNKRLQKDTMFQVIYKEMLDWTRGPNMINSLNLIPLNDKYVGFSCHSLQRRVLWRFISFLQTIIKTGLFAYKCITEDY